MFLRILLLRNSKQRKIPVVTLKPVYVFLSLKPFNQATDHTHGSKQTFSKKRGSLGPDLQMNRHIFIYTPSIKTHTNDCYKPTYTHVIFPGSGIKTPKRQLAPRLRKCFTSSWDEADQTAPSLTVAKRTQIRWPITLPKFQARLSLFTYLLIYAFMKVQAKNMSISSR